MADFETSPIDDSELRRVMGAFATGVAVVTTVGAGGVPVGLTANSFNSVSLDPPLVLWSLDLKAPSLPAFRTHDYFGVSILAEHQAELCRQFAVPARNKFESVAYSTGIGGVPLIEGVAASMACRTFARYPGGDHEIYVGEVLSLHAEDRNPLVIHRGSFKRLVPPPGER